MIGEEIVVERLVPGGRGLAVLSDGRTAFVAGGLPGDRLSIREGKEKKSYVEVSAFALVAPSEHRKPPPCAHAEECGGCDWMALADDHQLEQKRSILQQALVRTGGIEQSHMPQVSLISGDGPLNYRSRVRLQIREGKVGFFANKTHQLVEPESCLVMSAPLGQLFRSLKNAVRSQPEAFRFVDAVELRVFGSESPHSETASAHFLFPKKGRRPGKRELSRLRSACQSLSQSTSLRFGDESVALQTYQPTPDVRVGVQPGGFTQVNEAINRKLVSRVLEHARAIHARSFLDLYCGCGNFSVPLLAQGLEGVGIENSQDAIGAARLSAQGFDPRARFEAGRCEKLVSRLTEEEAAFDLVVVDPPRAGAKEVVPHLPRLARRSLVMISCDPVTLARDLKELLASGFSLEAIELYDMFPQTHHFETLAILAPPPS